MKTAYFNRFSIDIPDRAIEECFHAGKCDSDVEYWSDRIVRHDSITPKRLADELRGYGAWDDNELVDDRDNWHRIIWIACSNIKNEITE